VLFLYWDAPHGVSPLIYCALRRSACSSKKGFEEIHVLSRDVATRAAREGQRSQQTMTTEREEMNWSHGKSAMVCSVLAAVAFPLFLLFGRFGGVMSIASAILLVVGMGFFWSALWRTQCRDLWAWMALLVGVVTVFCSCVLVRNLPD
jgi:hypothetical protein